jgi:hypothetical protein
LTFFTFIKQMFYRGSSKYPPTYLPLCVTQLLLSAMCVLTWKWNVFYNLKVIYWKHKKSTLYWKKEHFQYESDEKYRHQYQLFETVNVSRIIWNGPLLIFVFDFNILVEVGLTWKTWMSFYCPFTLFTQSCQSSELKFTVK